MCREFGLLNSTNQRSGGGEGGGGKKTESKLPARLKGMDQE